MLISRLFDAELAEVIMQVCVFRYEPCDLETLLCLMGCDLSVDLKRLELVGGVYEKKHTWACTRDHACHHDFLFKRLRSCANSSLSSCLCLFPFALRWRAFQLTHNVFKTLLESCAELVWDQRCSNLVTTFDQIYFV